MRINLFGGGIGGLTTALALRQFGFEPDVFEQAHSSRVDVPPADAIDVCREESRLALVAASLRLISPFSLRTGCAVA